VGTGGGFPAVPLAIMFPQAKFTAVDSIGKKITVVKEVAAALGLDNLEAVNGRVEQLPGRFDYVVSRAVTEMKTLMEWTWSKIEKGEKGSLRNGIIVLKGGELAEELANAGKRFSVFSISTLFEEEFFATKKIIYLAK
jgi:16S rRNA (guanine527-N7)-methyltransferase